MRKPTPQRDLLQWWTDAIAGKSPPITSEPQCGWFRRKLVKNGPFVGVKIWMVQKLDADGELTEPEVLRCIVNGKDADPVDQWGWVANNPITEKEFNYLCDVSDWAEAHEPRDPHAEPKKAVDFLKSRVPF